MEELLINENQNITLTEDEVLEQSRNSVRTIVNALEKSKAFYNALAANAVISYLDKKGLIKGVLVNLHSSARMLADFEIADIQLQNLHIDVRAVFSDDEIFIPKKHFVNNFLPDIYLVVKFDEDLKKGTLLGYFKPSVVNKQNQNDEYYFVNKEVLSPVSGLAELILSAPIKNQYMINDTAENTIEKLIMLYMDQDIDDVKLGKLIDFLKNSVIAREKLVEFENFERLSYMALQEFKDLDVENNDFSKYIRTLVATDEFSEFEADDELDGMFSGETKSSGLFVDDERDLVIDVSEAAAPDAEELPLENAGMVSADSLETIEPAMNGMSNIEVNPVVNLPVLEMYDELVLGAEEKETSDHKFKHVEEQNTVSLDEFQTFEALDEFDLQDDEEEEKPAEESMQEDETEDEAEKTDDEVVDALEEEDVVEVSDAAIDGVSLDELAAVTESDIAEVAENLTEPTTDEDLEFQVEGLEELESELGEETFALNEETVEEIEVETAAIEPEEIITDIDKANEPQELNVEDALNLDEINLDGETVVGLSEGVLDVQDVEDVVPSLENSAEEIKAQEESMAGDELLFDDFDNLELSVDEKSEAAVSSAFTSVTDEQVDLAIAQSVEDIIAEEESNLPEKDESAADVSFASVDDADSLNLEDLLAMEEDLSAADDVPEFEQFREDEEDDSPVAEKQADDEGVFFYNPDDDEEDEKESAQAPMAGVADSISAESMQAKAEEISALMKNDEDGGMNFAFAVDSKSSNGKNMLVPIAALITVLGVVGAGAWYFLSHGKSSSKEISVDATGGNTAGDISLDLDDVAPTTVDLDSQLSDDTSNTPGGVAEDKPVTDVKVPAQTPKMDAGPAPEPLTIQKIKKDFSQPNTYLSVSKIVWDIPEYLTYNDDFSSYLQTLGSTLKLNLSSDLLLISENTMFDRVKVRVQLKDSGKKYSAEVMDGCGSQAVDDLVLQSVKNTLNLLKPPVNSLDTADEDLYVTIYL